MKGERLIPRHVNWYERNILVLRYSLFCSTGYERWRNDYETKG